MINSPTEANSSFFISIAGNIGCGKSSLTTLLAQNLQWKAFYEIVETNPYLTDFYSNMKQWSFHTQMFFLTKRYRHLLEILDSKEPVIQDRSIFEDAEVFAKALYLTGQMDERDYRTYVEHFETMTQQLRAPDILIYLRSSTETLQERIQRRARRYEMKIPESYLRKLNENYEAWFESYKRGPKCVIDVSRRDFVNRHEDLREILAIIQWEIECVTNRQQPPLPLSSRSVRSLTPQRPQV